MEWFASNAMWFAPLCAGLAVFAAVVVAFWRPTPKKGGRLIASWEIPDNEAFDKALVAGEPLPWQRVE